MHSGRELTLQHLIDCDESGGDASVTSLPDKKGCKGILIA